ncbi:MAG: hypothetical protein IPG59_13305 [Candidatus Melainabacteria bacterium]|nr:MAG: hypothetical protein IPG59_13305 [Candidatus Melainabacteria bacterium]
MIYLKIILGYLILMLSSALTVLFSVALEMGDAFPVLDQDGLLSLSAGWALASSASFFALSGVLLAVGVKNPGLVANMAVALVAVVVSLFALGHFFPATFVVANVWTGVPYAVFIVAISSVFAWAFSPPCVEKNFWVTNY